MPFYPAWKAFYASLTSPETPCRDVRAFQDCLGKDATTTECIDHLLAVSGQGAALVAVANQKVKLVHQFHFDRRTPLAPTSSNKLWALVGHGSNAACVTMTDEFFLAAEGIVPPPDEIGNITSATAFDELATPTQSLLRRNGASTFKGKHCIAIPAFVAVAIMQADTDDPVALIPIVSRILRDFDRGTVAGNRGTIPEADLPDGGLDALASEADLPSEHSAFQSLSFITAFLYLVGKKQMTGKILDINMTDRAAAWTAHRHQHLGIARNSTGGGGGGIGNNPTDIPDLLRNVTTQLSNVATSYTRVSGEMTKTAEALARREEARNSSKGIGKLDEDTLQLLLNATEVVVVEGDPPTDANGDPIKPPHEATDWYKKLMACKTSGEAQQKIHKYLNITKSCSAAIPTSTCIAAYQVRICWLNPDKMEAFSIMSCFHEALDPDSKSTTAPSGDDALRLGLQASEGDGLSPADVRKATKQVFYSPRSFDDLHKMVSIFQTLLGGILGDFANLPKALRSVLDHMRDHEQTWRRLASQYKLFCLRFAAWIDRRTQRYFQECLRASSPDAVDNKWLDWDGMLFNILDHQVNALPAAPDFLETQLLATVRKRLSLQGAGESSEDDADADPLAKPKSRRQKQKRAKQGTLVFNPKVQATWKTTKRNVPFFVKRISQAPGWPDKGPNGNTIRPCLKYHLHGECHDECHLATTHKPMPASITPQFGQWVTKTTRDLDQQGTTSDADPDKR